ncbi:LIM/homeobox protein Awh-like [Haliotis rubra]|uniref:LIM/homeobox protein Awh-like n=1 Tax=Haliotis rubra TaxID=36100 RepID=UPI001EE5FB53|nr:LIM/homeobox protein Awh-like [Haliotis rubra]
MSDMSYDYLSSDLEESADFIALSFNVADPLCFTCCDVITDQYYLRAGDHVWHEHCLRCCVCQVTLGGHSTCFVRDGNIFCQRDFAQVYKTKCSSCLRPIESGDWVRSAGENMYHLACFSCSTCQRQLSTGEDFAIHDGRVLCRVHALNPDDENVNCRSKSKRFRTVFNEDQVAVLQKYFDLDTNPAGSDLGMIAEEAGLPRRVAQVWFQNARAKLKRAMH